MPHHTRPHQTESRRKAGGKQAESKWTAGGKQAGSRRKAGGQQAKIRRKALESGLLVQEKCDTEFGLDGKLSA